MDKNILEVAKLSHRYSNAWAIEDISFKINKTGVLGLLGSNGAGKSTTMNIMCGVLNQTQGDVFIDGIDLSKEPLQAKKLIGFLPQNAPLHLELTVDEYLIHCAHMRLVEKDKISSAVAAAKEKCGVAHFSKRLISNLSGGYRQRVGIAQSIIHTPKLVVLDEPTNGLDPNQVIEVRRLINEIAEERAVIFSSHILSEVQATCKDIIMIESGKIVFADTMEAFNNYIEPNSVLIDFAHPPSIEELKAIPGIKKAELLNGAKIRLQYDASPDITERIVELSVKNGWRLREITLERSSLDTVFAQLSNNNTD